jgi:hypothetical protein
VTLCPPIVINKKQLKQVLAESDETIAKKEIYEMLKSLISCNNAANLAKGKDIFKATNKGFEALLDISYLTPNDILTFGNFIDNLYILFYEGAGDDNLRFLKNNGGVLEKNECEFIWCVKVLRNKWLRHDIDHGNVNKIKASREALRDAFKWLGLNHYPKEPEDFRCLHSKLIKESRKFLGMIPERINN